MGADSFVPIEIHSAFEASVAGLVRCFSSFPLVREPSIRVHVSSPGVGFLPVGHAPPDLFAILRRVTLTV